MISYGYGSHKQNLNPEKKETENDKFWRKVPSLDSKHTGPLPKPKVYKSTKHTIAPAYNKGPYQVISETNIKDIGR